MAVAADYMDGNTHIIIRDDYFVRSKEEIEAVLERISEIYVRIFTDQAMAEIDKKKFGKEMKDI